MEKTKKAAHAGTEEEEGICGRKVNQWGCKNASADNEQRYCEEHYKDLKMERKKKLPPYEQRCSETNGNGWRCKNFRMGLGEDENGVIPKSKLCEKHYNYRVKSHFKKTSGDGEGAGCSATGPIQCRGEEDNRSLDVTGATSDIQGGSADAGTKRKLPPDEQRCGRTGFRGWRCKNFRMGHAGAAEDDTVPNSRYCEKHYILRAKNYENLKKRSRDGEGGGSAKIGAKRKKIETSEKLKPSTGISEPIVELENLDHYKTNCFQVSVELELAKKELELVKIKLELEKKTAARDEDETEYWRNKCSDLEILVLALEIEYLTMRYEDRSILRCQELRSSEKIKCQALGLQNEITQTGDNVEEWEDWDCLEETPSQAHVLEMSKDTLGNLVSGLDDGGDSLGKPEDSNGFVDSEISLCEPIDRQAMNEVDLDWE